MNGNIPTSRPKAVWRWRGRGSWRLSLHLIHAIGAHAKLLRCELTALRASEQKFRRWHRHDIHRRRLRIKLFIIVVKGHKLFAHCLRTPYSAHFAGWSNYRLFRQRQCYRHRFRCWPLPQAKVFLAVIKINIHVVELGSEYLHVTFRTAARATFRLAFSMSFTSRLYVAST